jgi:hypothetical protein
VVQQRREHETVVLVPQDRVLLGRDEPLPRARVVAAHQRVELREQTNPDVTDRATDAVGQVPVVPAVWAGTDAEPVLQPCERRIDLPQPDAGPPGHVVAAGRSVAA